jgi:hypothetical protein
MVRLSNVSMRRVALSISTLMVLAAGFLSLVLPTREFDLAPCSIYNEFSPCGHQTDYRVGLRVAIFAAGVLLAAATWWFTTRVKRKTD